MSSRRGRPIAHLFDPATAAIVVAAAAVSEGHHSPTTPCLRRRRALLLEALLLLNGLAALGQVLLHAPAGHSSEQYWHGPRPVPFSSGSSSCGWEATTERHRRLGTVFLPWWSRRAGDNSPFSRRNGYSGLGKPKPFFLPPLLLVKLAAAHLMCGEEERSKTQESSRRNNFQYLRLANILYSS